MSKRSVFEATLGSVCERQGWALSKTRVEVKFADRRHQAVSLDFFEFEGEELVRFYTAIGSVKRIDALRLNDALRMNFGLPHGSLAVKDDELVMVDTLLVDDADPGEIEASILYLAETADHFEKTMFGTDDN